MFKLVPVLISWLLVILLNLSYPRNLPWLLYIKSGIAVFGAARRQCWGCAEERS